MNTSSPSHYTNNPLPKVLFLLAMAALPFAAHAGDTVTFVVDSTADEPDADTTDGICSSILVPDPATPSCTLRAAIMQGNAMPASNQIHVRLAAGEQYVLSGNDALNDDSGDAGDLEITRQMDIRTSPTLNPASITGADIDRLFELRNGAAGTTISFLKLSNGSLAPGCIIEAEPDAGALVLDHVEIHDSICGPQGALYLTNTPTTIRSSNIHHNRRVIWSVAAVVTIERSTFHDNVDMPNLVFGTNSVANVIDSTFSGNYKPLTARDSQLFVVHSTFTDSTMEHIAFKTSDPARNLQLRNSLLSAPGTTNCAFYTGADVPVDIAGTVYVSGTASDDVSCIANSAQQAAANLYNATIELGPLADQGGPTPTHEQLPTSESVDWVDPSHCNAAATDQRGYPRVVSYFGDDPAPCDAGATELQPDPSIFRDSFETL